MRFDYAHTPTSSRFITTSRCSGFETAPARLAAGWGVRVLAGKCTSSNRYPCKTIVKPIVPEAIDAYAAAHSSDHSPLLEELQAYTLAHCKQPQMLVGRLEGALLRLLVKLTGARRVLEIGLFTGYSALSMAEALPDDGELISCDRDPETSRIAQSFFDRSPYGHKITIRLGSALDTLKSLPLDSAFDLAFLDADKKNSCAYYDLVLPRLKTGGLLITDNALWSGNVLKPKDDTDHGLVAFNQRVQNDPSVENVLLTVRDGVMLIRKISES